MGESNTVVSAYTMYRHLQQYCCHPSNYCYLTKEKPIPVGRVTMNCFLVELIGSDRDIVITVALWYICIW